MQGLGCDHKCRCWDVSTSAGAWGVTTSTGAWAGQKGVLDSLKQELQAVLSIWIQVLKTKLGPLLVYAPLTTELFVQPSFNFLSIFVTNPLEQGHMSRRDKVGRNQLPVYR